MGKPTEKMVWSLVNRFGYPVDVVNNMTYEQASGIISNRVVYEKPTQGGSYTKTLVTPEIESASTYKPKFSKPAYNPSSQYVSYAKDIYLALRGYMSVETKGVGVEDKIVMDQAIKLVKQAIAEFE